MEQQTDIQTPYSFNGQLSSDLNRRQIPCIAASQRPTGLLLLCSLPQNACADSPLMARALYFLWLLHEENGCNCSKEIVAMHSKMWIFYDITCFVIHKSSSCWKSWAFSNFQWKNQHIDIQQDAMMVIFICFEIQVLTLATALIWMIKSQSRAGWKILMCESKWYTQLSVLLGHPARYSSTRAKRCLHILSIHKLWNCIREDTTLLLKWIHDPLWASIQWSLSVIYPSGMGDTDPLERTASITLRVQEITTDTLKQQENAEDEK